MSHETVGQQNCNGKQEYAVRSLRQSLPNLGPDRIQRMQECLFLPLVQIINSTKTSENLRCEALHCISEIFRQSKIITFSKFEFFFNLCSQAISDPADFSKVKGQLSDEFKIAVITCLDELCNSCSSGVLFHLYQTDMLPMLGHGVSVVLHLVATEKDRILRCKSLSLLQRLITPCTADGKLTTNLIGDILSAFLPGISQQLCRIIVGPITEDSHVTVLAIETLNLLFEVVLGDEHLENEVAADTEVLTCNPHSLRVHRTPSWVAEVSDKLAVIVNRLASVSSHSNWRVRRAMVALAESLITHNGKSLTKSVPCLLDILVQGLSHEFPQVASFSQEKLISVSRLLEESKTVDLLVLLQDNIQSLARKLPRVIRMADNSTKLATVQLLTGYLKLLRHQAKQTFSLDSHLHHIGLALLQAFELDCTSIHLLQALATDASAGDRQRKRFVFFDDSKIECELRLACRLLGHYGDLQVLVDYFLCMSHKSGVYRKQAIIILNELVLGAADEGLGKEGSVQRPVDITLLQNTVAMLIPDYLHPDNWQLLTSNRINESYLLQTQTVLHKTITIEQLNHNIWQICLQLEGLADFSKALKDKFIIHLMDVLYAVLEKLVSDSPQIQQLALTVLLEIAENCGYESREGLVLQNADYLINSISLQLRHLRRNPQVIRVLQATIVHGSKDILPLLEDTLQEMLDVIDLFHEQHTCAFLCILQSLVTSICAWHSKHHAIEAAKDNQMEAHCMTDRIICFLNDLDTRRKDAEGWKDPCDYATNAADEYEERTEFVEESKEEKRPLHLQMTIDVLDRCAHLLSSVNAKHRLMTLNIIDKGIIVLSRHENDLLPMVHKLWIPLLSRITDPDLVIVKRSFEVLLTMARHARSFLCQRVRKEALPKLTDFLDRQGHKSAKTGPAYKTTLVCKVQLAMLSGIGDLARFIELDESSTNILSYVCAIYLDCQQPRCLQDTALSLMAVLADIYPDIVWLILISLHCPGPIHPPHPALQPLKVLLHCERNKYSDNVCKLLALPVFRSNRT